MAVFMKEIRHGLLNFCIWTAATAFMIIICILMFPEMKGQMNDVTDLFSNMGGFTEAFGMDKVGFGEIMGFYAVECGNILGIGGGFFAAFIGISYLAKEEKDRTAEFLLTHPVSRIQVLTEKLSAIFLQMMCFNIVVIFSSIISFLIIGEEVAWKEFWLLHFAFFIMQVEVGCICFGISAFLKKSGMGIGLGLTMILYFVNIIKNITDRAEFLKYVTPFAYADASSIVSDCKIETGLVVLGVVTAIIFLIAGYVRYNGKDIAA